MQITVLNIIKNRRHISTQTRNTHCRGGFTFNGKSKNQNKCTLLFISLLHKKKIAQPTILLQECFFIFGFVNILNECEWAGTFKLCRNCTDVDRESYGTWCNRYYY